MKKKAIGTVLSGSLTDGFLMRLLSHTDIETIKTGKFVSIAGYNSTFFSLITDLKLEVAHPELVLIDMIN